jgi:hypothetical protein
MDEVIALAIISIAFLGINLAIYSGIKRAREKSRIDYKTKSGGAYFAYPMDRSRRLTMGIVANIPVKFTLEYTSWMQRLAAWLGFTRILHTGDGNFDRQVYIESDDPQFCGRLESNPALRQAVLRLFHYGIYKISAVPGRLTVTIANVRQALDENSVDTAIAQLVTVRELLSAAALPGPHPINRRAKLFNRLILYSFWLSVYIGFFTYAQRFITYNPFSLFEYSLQFAIAAVALCLITIQRMFQNSSLGYLVFFNFILYGIAACVLWSASIVCDVNVYGDTSKVTEYDQRVVDKWWRMSYVRGARFIIYELSIDDWHNRAMSYTLKVSSTTYSRIHEGEKVRIFSHPGYFGYEWFTYQKVQK